MDMLLDAAYGMIARRDPLLPSATLRAPPPETSAVALTPTPVTPVAASEHSKPTEEDDRRRQRPQDRQPETLAEKAALAYETRLVYEEELRRTFLDVVDRDNEEERLVRIPPEQIVRFVEELKAEAMDPPAAYQHRFDFMV